MLFYTSCHFNHHHCIALFEYAVFTFLCTFKTYGDMIDTVDIVTWHRHWPQPGPKLVTCHVSPTVSLAACPRSRHHVSLLLMATRSPHVSPPSHTGQHVPGRCWGRAQGSGGQSWGQQSTSPCWTDTGCSVYRVFIITQIFTLSCHSDQIALTLTSPGAGVLCSSIT